MADHPPPDTAPVRRAPTPAPVDPGAATRRRRRVAPSVRRGVAAGLAAGLLLVATGTPADRGAPPRQADRPTEAAAPVDEPQPSLALMAAVLALVGLTAAWRMRAARENVPLARLAARMPPPADPGRVAAQRRADEAFRELRRIARDARTVAAAPGTPDAPSPPVAPRAAAETADI